MFSKLNCSMPIFFLKNWMTKYLWVKWLFNIYFPDNIIDEFMTSVALVFLMLWHPGSILEWLIIIIRFFPHWWYVFKHNHFIFIDTVKTWLWISFCQSSYTFLFLLCIYCFTTTRFSHNYIYIYVYIYTHTHTHTHTHTSPSHPPFPPL